MAATAQMPMIKAVAHFVATYTSMPPANIRFGYKSREALPSVNRYAIIFIDGIERVGTNLIDWTKTGDEVISSKVLRQYKINVDICDTDEQRAYNAAAALENLCRSFIAADFFRQYGATADYADDIESLPFVGEQDQYIYRYRVRLVLERWEETSPPQQFAERVAVSRLANVDAAYKP